MKTFLTALPLLALCGCLSPVSVPTVAYWPLEYRESSVVAKTPRFGIARLSQVVVNAPYAGDRLVVLRQDGTVAFDAHNFFAAQTPALLKGVGLAALRSSGLFADVVGASSGASASVSVELYVSRMALDCRQEDLRRAVVELNVRVLDGKRILAAAEGADAADATDGDYGVAFSKAVSAAISSAMSKLR